MKNRVLIVSPNAAFGECMREIFSGIGETEFQTETKSFEAMNGKASDVIAKHDVVIFEANPDEPTDLESIAGVRLAETGQPILLALTNNDVTVAKARRLREAGVDEVLPVSITGPELIWVIEDLKRRRGAIQTSSARNGDDCQIIPVMQARGGIGSTTTSVNLACELVGRSSMFHKVEKKRVAVLDFDLQFGNANVFLDLEDNNGFLDLIEAEDPPDANFLRGVMQNHSSGISLLSAPGPMVPLQSLRAELVGSVLDTLRMEFDYIIVDMPRAMVEWVVPVLSRASRLVMVTDTSVPTVRQARRIIDFVHEEHFALPVELVVNHEKRPLIKSEHCREAEKVLKAKIGHWVPDNPKLARSAADLGQPYVNLKPNSDLAKAIAKLAGTMASAPQPTATKTH